MPGDFIPEDSFAFQLQTLITTGTVDQPDGLIGKSTRTERVSDHLDRLVERTDREGLTTRYDYSEDGRTATTTLPGGATRIETRHLDGQTASISGTSVIAQFYDYAIDPDTGEQITTTRLARPDGPRYTRSLTNALGQTTRTERPGFTTDPENAVILATHQAYDTAGRAVRSWQTANGEAVGAESLITYTAEGEVDLAGQDIDQNGQLEPASPDRLARSETAFEKVDGTWFQVQRSYTFPFEDGENHGTPHLASESRTRASNLGGKHPTYGVLTAHQQSLKDGKVQSETMRFKDVEQGTETTVTNTAAGAASIAISRGGLLLSTAIGKVDDPPEDLVTTTYAYDALGRRTTVTDPRTGPARTEYEGTTRRVAAQIDAAGNQTSYTYHPDTGQLAATTNAEGHTQRLAYNERGNQIATWGQTAYPLTYEYNAYGELTALGTFQQDQTDDLALDQLAQPHATTRWHYDEATGLLLHKAYDDGKGPRYTYTSQGQLATRQWARKTAEATPLTTTYDYDPVTAELVHIDYGSEAPLGPQASRLRVNPPDPRHEVAYTYTRNGQIAQVTDFTGTRRFTYSPEGQETHESVTLTPVLPGEAPITYQIARTYDDRNNPASVHLTASDPQTDPITDRDEPRRPSEPNPVRPKIDHRITYDFDHLNRIAQVTSLAGTFDYQYHSKSPSLLTRMIAPAHRVDTSYEDTRNLITGIASTATLGEHADKALTAYTYQNDTLGRRAAIGITGVAPTLFPEAPASPLTPPSSPLKSPSGALWTEVAYNTKSEVIGTTDYRGPIPATPQAPVPETFLRRQTYQFDNIGNREKATRQIGDQSEETTTYEANALNLYTSIEQTEGVAATAQPAEQKPIAKSQQPTADESGNLVEDDGFIYTWDGNNRLTAAESKNGTNRVEHRYDHQGRRIRSVYLAKSETDWQPTEIKTFVYDGWNVAAELTRVAEDTEIELLTWGRDLSGSLQGAGGVGGVLAISEATGDSDIESDHRFFHYDANGNVVAVANDVGTIQAQYRYDGFGRELASAGPLAQVNEYRFSTKPIEKVTGMSYYGFRYYVPETGRWASRDPIEEDGGVNLVGFVSNYGIGSTDVFGLKQFQLDDKVTWSKKTGTGLFFTGSSLFGVGKLEKLVPARFMRTAVVAGIPMVALSAKGSKAFN